MRDPQRDAFRKDAYERLERKDPARWERLRGCTVTHCVFGEGVISKVMMPDWSNPVHFTVAFGEQAKTFHLSSLGDRTKFSASGLPDELAGVIARVEAEIAQEEQRREEDLQRRDQAAAEVVLRRKEQANLLLTQRRQAEEDQEASRAEDAAARLSGMRDKVNQDLPLTAEDVRFLVESREHDLLLGYYKRAYARANDYRAVLKASTIWRDARQPEYALQVIGLLLDGLEQRAGSARASILLARGGALLDLHRLEEAKQCALGALESAGEGSQANQLLGEILVRSGDAAEAMRSFAKAAHLASKQGAPRLERAQQAAIQQALQPLDPESKKAFARELQRADPERYSYLKIDRP